MSPFDAINAVFEVVAGCLQLWNCRVLLRDRCVMGVDWRVTAFFAAWGIWNLAFYPHLAQWLSFAGGVLITVANLSWVALALRFSRRPRRATVRGAAESAPTRWDRDV